jgi:hypothetical protein
MLIVDLNEATSKQLPLVATRRGRLAVLVHHVLGHLPLRAHQ